MKEFFMQYWFILFVDTVITGFIVYLLVNRRLKKLREIAYKESVIVGTKKDRRGLIWFWISFIIWCHILYSQKSIRAKA
jgi:hypothetical protein